MDVTEKAVCDLEEVLFNSPDFQGVRELISMTLPNTGCHEPLNEVLQRVDSYGSAMRSLWQSVLPESP